MTAAEFRQSMLTRAAAVAEKGAKTYRRMTVMKWCLLIAGTSNAAIFLWTGKIWNIPPAIILCLEACWYQRLARNRMNDYLKLRQDILTAMELALNQYFRRL